MIEVIKHGKKKFTATCSNCGCEFTYEVEDIIDGKITCPDCGHYVPHLNFNSIHGIYYPPKQYGNMITFDAATMSTGGVYTTEKAKTDDSEDAVLYGTQMFKDQMSKTTAIPCVDKE